MWLLIFLLPFFGDFAIAAAPQVTPQSSPTGGLASVFTSQGQFVHSLKTDLRDTILMQQMATEARKFDDYSHTYSHGVSEMLTELRSFIISGEDNLFDAIKPVHGWCGTAKDLLKAYTSLFHQSNPESIEAQNQIIQSMFAEDISTTVSTELNKLSNNLNRASTTLSSIFTQFDADFSEQSPFFESTLRNEFVKENNKRYTSELINSIIAALKKFTANTQQVIAEGAIKVAAAALEDHQVLDLAEAVSQANQQQQPAGGSAGNQQGTQAPTAVDVQLYLPYKDRVVYRFSQTKDFFKNFERQLKEMIRHTNEVKSKLAQHDQLVKSSKMTEYAVSVRLPAAQENHTKRAAQSLMNQCKSFNLTPLTH
ncbi:uncharacterized protein LOC126750591 isoform X2 [Anthonomus grandis grandis]|uniref:uncharacterized protein LOC126750591 isoform X2 n=1 Tax=Anthonomus grandis grandis TaxID=2921223 RepID=UPI0021654AC3|nr:uncharacterized protein LOC126750591 isoform X2 [Anthonomus grandis grandis]